ncbi:hypothetical protein PPYR_12653 [Photinus pyralis]|uniref:Uncharacterized protein n=1 Tax=Photinus pyralis TaxID=7054 RepID=A0A1Y1L0Y3_PHOPY|nr:hypothetical protein PPYR_12653 [Photinus pyralis]
MLSTYLPNFLSLSYTEMFLFVISWAFTTATGITAFLMFSSRTFNRLKNDARPSPIAPDGNETNFTRDLENHLEGLERRLLKKAAELKRPGTAGATTENLEMLAVAQAKVQKYYTQLKQEIKNSEDEFGMIQAKIERYTKRRVELEREEYYTTLLRDVPKVPVPMDKSLSDQSLEGDAVPKSAGGETRRSLMLSGRSSFQYTRPNKKETPNKGPSAPHSLPKLDSVKQLKDRFSGPINLCCCGSISCARNCVPSKRLKMDMQSQQQLIQNIAPHCTESVGKTIGGLRGTAALCSEGKA